MNTRHTNPTPAAPHSYSGKSDVTGTGRLIQRFQDWRLERRILKARNRCIASFQTPDARHRYTELMDLVAQRSPQQVARMERRKGLR